MFAIIAQLQNAFSDIVTPILMTKEGPDQSVRMYSLIRFIVFSINHKGLTSMLCTMSVFFHCLSLLLVCCLALFFNRLLKQSQNWNSNHSIV